MNAAPQLNPLLRQLFRGSFRTLLPVTCLVTLLACLVLATGASAGAQPTGISPLNPPPNSPKRADSTWHSIVNATAHTRPGEVIENAAIIFRDGIIVAVKAGEEGKELDTGGARVWDAKGLHVYPGFIDAHIDVAAPEPEANAPGVHWNSRIMPQRSALDGTGIDDRTAESLRRLGFTAGAIAPRGGIFRGTAAVVSLARPASEQSADRPPVYRERAYHGVAFDTSRRGRGGDDDLSRWTSYPNSQMGAIAVIRQTLIDADWQVEARRAGGQIAANALDHLAAASVQVVTAGRSARIEEGRARRGDESRRSDRGDQDLGLDLQRGLPLVFDTDDELEALRAAKIAREFDRPGIILGSGYEFRRLEAIARDGLPIILPLRFPRAPDVSSVGRADSVELRDMMTWEQAPTNPRRLDEAGIKVALTTSKLRNRNEFEPNLTRAIRHGLPPERAMAMLTTIPAEMLGVADRMGTIEVGKAANLVIADGPLFVGFAERTGAGAGEESGEADAKAEEGDRPGAAGQTATTRGRIRDVWVDGFRHEISQAPVRNHVGRWQVSEMSGRRIDPAAAEGFTITITRNNQITFRRNARAEGRPATPPTNDVRATNVRVQGTQVDLAVDGSVIDSDGVVLVGMVVEGDALHGTSLLPGGSLIHWTARRLADAPEEGAARRASPPAAPLPAPRQPADTFAGTWHLTMDDQPEEEVTLTITRDLSVSLLVGGQMITGMDVQTEGNNLTFRFDSAMIGFEGLTEASIQRDGDSLSGSADIPAFDVVAFSGTREPGTAPPEEAAQDEQAVAEGADVEEGAQPAARRGARPAATPARDADREEREAIAQIPEQYGYPFGPYMMEHMPEQKAVLFTNATIWTAGPDGVIENGWMFIRDGKIAAIGQGGPPGRFGDIEVVDLAGKHLAPGIIDCHSHTGISRGVNESGQAVTSEVRIADVTNPDAISWYRQLASGVTTVNNLHGSANAIGGQSQTNKIRWGARHPDDKHMEGATPGIKFALGENVKQSNWGDRATTRYPQTRMGVETLIRDRFKAAREYAAMHNGARTQYLGDTPMIGPLFAKLPTRRDLELEALAEILAGERLVHCHSYRQDEILMLCRIAEEFGFRIGTFQHILEGYKVADEVAKHAIGASAFSDWWAFKVEVQDAIPQGGPIMWEEGVVVSFNSDSDELARRMNGEAAKAVKYSSPDRPIEPHEALKFITLNPAIQLGVASRIGSLEVGKDADFAIWSGPPLSSMSRCEATYVDGRRLFSLEDDQKHREVIRQERQRLIQKILSESRRRPGTTPGAGGRGREDRDEPGEARFAGDDSPRRSMMRAYYLDLVNRGIDPSAARPGDCGCDELEFHVH